MSLFPFQPVTVEYCYRTIWVLATRLAFLGSNICQNLPGLLDSVGRLIAYVAG